MLVNVDAEYSGVVPVSRLLLAAPEQHMSELKSQPLISVTVSDREGDVFELFDKYNLRMLTVVNEQNHPIGAIAVDDVVSRLVKSRD